MYPITTVAKLIVFSETAMNIEKEMEYEAIKLKEAFNENV